MYGTIMRARIKPGGRAQFERWVKEWEDRRGSPEGYHSSELAWEDADPERIVLIVHFADKGSYRKNAESPEQAAEYQEMVALLDGEPEWIDVNYAGYAGKPLPA